MSIDDRYRSEGSRLTKSLDKKPIEHLIFFFSFSLSLSRSLFYLDLNRPPFRYPRVPFGQPISSLVFVLDSRVAKFGQFIFFLLKKLWFIRLNLYFAHHSRSLNLQNSLFLLCDIVFWHKKISSYCIFIIYTCIIKYSIRSAYYVVLLLSTY